MLILILIYTYTLRTDQRSLDHNNFDIKYLTHLWPYAIWGMYQIAAIPRAMHKDQTTQRIGTLPDITQQNQQQVYFKL